MRPTHFGGSQPLCGLNGKAARCWAHAHDQGPLHRNTAEADLHAWLQMPDAPVFATDLRVALLSVRGPERRPHLTNASVAFQPPELAALGYASPTMVLHWILSPELLPLVGNDVPVCGADRAWRFGCVPPCLLSAETRDSIDSVTFPSMDCALFCKLLGETRDDGVPSRHFRELWDRRKRVHIFPCMKGSPFELEELRQALEHPDSLLSFHVEAGKDARVLIGRLRALVPDTPPWSVLRGPADGHLVLPAAWDTALTAKQSGLYQATRMHAYVAPHGRYTPVDVYEKLAEGARAFFFAATPVSALGARAAGLPPLPPSVAHVLKGRHWLAGSGVAGQLALLGFLPRRWSYTRDLYSRRTGRALQKAYELLCWWRLSDRVHRRRTLTLELEAELDKDALADLDPDAHALALLRSEHLGKASDATLSDILHATCHQTCP